MPVLHRPPGVLAEGRTEAALHPLSRSLAMLETIDATRLQVWALSGALDDDLAEHAPAACASCAALTSSKANHRAISTFWA